MNYSWNVNGTPERNVLCHLYVADMRNVFQWNTSLIGAWDGKQWTIRVFNPEIGGGCVISEPAAPHLAVLAWRLAERPDVYRKNFKDWSEPAQIAAVRD